MDNFELEEYSVIVFFVYFSSDIAINFIEIQMTEESVKYILMKEFVYR